VNKVPLNLQRPLWEGDQEVAKRYGRDEPMWVAIHKCMEATLGTSLYSYLYLKLVKMTCLSYCFLCFLFNKIREKEDRIDSARSRVLGGGEVALTLFTHVSKCKSHKMKGQKNKICL
jgi:hypothetical protein